MRKTPDCVSFLLSGSLPSVTSGTTLPSGNASSCQESRLQLMQYMQCMYESSTKTMLAQDRGNLLTKHAITDISSSSYINPISPNVKKLSGAPGREKFTLPHENTSLSSILNILKVLETLKQQKCNWGLEYNFEVVCKSVRVCEIGSVRVQIYIQNYLKTNNFPPHSVSHTAYFSPFRTVPYYSILVQPITTYFSLVQYISTYSSLFQPIPAHSCLFQPIPAYSSVFQNIPACSILFQPIPAYSSIFKSISAHSKLLQHMPPYSSLIHHIPA